MKLSKYLIYLPPLLPAATCQCFDPSPSFPIPSWGTGGSSLASTLQIIEHEIHQIVAKEAYKASSFSLELTSASSTIWSLHHTARHRNETRPGTESVDENSVYRISAVTKVFTILGLLRQHDAETLNMEDPISKYVPELGGDIQWENITLRSLASHLSGIPREFAHSDMINQFQDPVAMGLPPGTKEGCPTCDEYNDYKPCARRDSNVGAELIALALENVTGMDLVTYLREAVLEPLGMKATSMDAPADDENAVLPIWSKGDNYWGIDTGVQNATAGLYTTSADMGKFMRYVLRNANQITRGVNWFMPASWSTGFRTFYGMPWEILRTEKVLKERQRPVTFVSKSGGMPGYYSRVTFMPEYGLGLTILVGGETGLLSELLELITTRLIREADPILWGELSGLYDGTYEAVEDGLKSSLTISSAPVGGMRVTSFISNGTDALHQVFGREASTERWHAQLVPTMLSKDEAKKRGDIWRLIIVPERLDQTDLVWDDLCGTDVDTGRYAGVPANEFVFWHDEGVVELPAWKVKLKRERQEKMVVQPWKVDM